MCNTTADQARIAITVDFAERRGTTTGSDAESDTGDIDGATDGSETTGTPIPGLAPVDVYGNLEDEGWACDGPNTGELYVSWVCDLPGTLAVVEIFSTNASDVVSVEASTFDASEWPWLEYVATPPLRRRRPGRGAGVAGRQRTRREPGQSTGDDLRWGAVPTAGLQHVPWSGDRHPRLTTS